MKYIFYLFFKTILFSKYIFTVVKSLIHLHENEILGIDEIEKTRDIVPDTIHIDELKQHINTDTNINTHEYKQNLHKDDIVMTKNLKKLLHKINDKFHLNLEHPYNHMLLKNIIATIENYQNVNSDRRSILQTEDFVDINTLAELDAVSKDLISTTNKQICEFINSNEINTDLIESSDNDSLGYEQD